MAERNRFMYFRTNKIGKSSSEEEGTIWFARKESGSPRKVIYKNECPSQLDAFESCLQATNNNLTECAAQNSELLACAGEAFKKINAMDKPYDYSKGLQSS